MRFTEHPDIQLEVASQKAGFGAKLVAKKYRKLHSRADFDLIRIDVMRWCLQLKLANHRKFGDALILTGSRSIVEESHKDDWWGTKLYDDTYKGCNVLGQLLMELREQYQIQLLEESRDYKLVVPPAVSDFYFLGKEIGSFDLR